MERDEVLSLIRECVVEATVERTDTHEDWDGYLSYEHWRYVDADKMLLAIDRLLGLPPTTAEARTP